MSGKALAKKKSPYPKIQALKVEIASNPYKSVIGLCCGTSHFMTAQAIK